MERWKRIGIFIGVVLLIVGILSFLMSRGLLGDLSWEKIGMWFAGIFPPLQLLFNSSKEDTEGTAENILKRHEDIEIEEEKHRQKMDEIIKEKEKKIENLDKEVKAVESRVELLNEKKKNIDKEVSQMSDSEKKKEAQDLWGK